MLGKWQIIMGAQLILSIFLSLTILLKRKEIKPVYLGNSCFLLRLDTQEFFRRAPKYSYYGAHLS